MTPSQKIKWLILAKLALWNNRAKPVYPCSNIDMLYHSISDREQLYDAMEDVYSSGRLTGIAHDGPSRCHSVAMQLPNGSWVGWLYAYYAYGETVADGWINNSYDVVLREEEQAIIVQTFTRGI
jgi:hypothetical protein